MNNFIENNKYIKISFGGDIMCSKEQSLAVYNKYGKYNYHEYFEGLKPLFNDSDYVLANLETPITDNQEYSSSSINFNTPSSILEYIKECGIHFLSTANNHCLDRGVKGLEETITNLNKYGLEHSGTYETENDSETLFIKEINGVKLAIVCCTYGTNSEHNGVFLPSEEQWRVNLLKKQKKLQKLKFDPSDSNKTVTTYIADDTSPAAIKNIKNQQCLEKIKRQIVDAKNKSDIVIVMPHVGGQYNPVPGYYTRYIIEELSSVGADFIIAGHPHVPLKFSNINNTFVVYSLGNLASTPSGDFFFPNVFSEYGIVLHVYIDINTKQINKCTFQLTKCIIDDCGITKVKPIYDLYTNESVLTQKERLSIDNEALVNRLISAKEAFVPEFEYSIYEL